MKLVIDTNVLVSALINPTSSPARLLSHWRAKAFTLLSTDLQLEELTRVTRYPKIRARLKPAIAGELINDIRALADLIEKLPTVDVSPDPYDNFLLALAQAGKAQWLVSGDKRDVLSLGVHKATRIVTAQTALAAVGVRA